MPRNWIQSGDKYTRSNYIDDPIPLKVENANNILEDAVKQIKALGVTLRIDSKPSWQWKVTFETS